MCAGFALYGPCTMLILTTGEGVDGFTLDRDIGAFILTHPQLRILCVPRIPSTALTSRVVPPAVRL